MDSQITKSLNDVKLLCGDCTLCDKCCSQLPVVAYTKSTTEMLELLNCNKLCDKMESDFDNFLIMSKNYEMLIGSIVYGELMGLYKSNIPFGVDLFFNLDKLFIQWNSWLRRTNLFIRGLLLNGIVCPKFNEIMEFTLIEYYKSNEDNYMLDFKKDIFGYYFNYLVSCHTPKTVKDYVDVVVYLGEGIISYFTYIISQYAQQFMINNKNERFYYSGLFQHIGYLGEKTIEHVLTEISKFSDTIDVYMLHNLSKEEMSNFTESIINKKIRHRFKHITLVLPPSSKQSEKFIKLK